ncbi:ATP-binding protein [Streptomyces sp. NPDC007074]|uniref:ATP-binding protein n=1 Tax=Streptomyces sp. NPDC007074 TaxID=3156764 RepID=UPI0033D77E8D
MGSSMTTGSPWLVDCEDVAWFRDQPEGARGAAAALGRRIGLGVQRTAELVMAVAELVTNADKHAVDGSVLLRVLRNEAVAGVEVVVVDSGPGMADVPAALRDGMFHRRHSRHRTGSGPASRGRLRHPFPAGHRHRPAGSLLAAPRAFLAGR